MDAFRGLKTVIEIAAEFEVHPVMVSNWKKEMLASLPEFKKCSVTCGGTRPLIQ